MNVPPYVSAPLRIRWRGLAVLAALAAGAVHVPVIGEHLEEAPYMGVLFILLTVAAVLVAVVVWVRDSPAVYAVGAVICALAVAGYAATRVVAFPDLADDVGNWFEPLGVAAVVSETAFVGLAAAALHQRSRGAPGRRS